MTRVSVRITFHTQERRVARERPSAQTGHMTDPQPSTSSQSWRGVIAALANEELRAEYARLVLEKATSNHRRAAQLVRAGLAEVHDGQVTPAVDALRAMLADRSAERPQRGPQRFLRHDGRIDRYPSQYDDRVELLQFVADAVLAPHEHVGERALNERLLAFDSDTALLRRYLVDYRIVEREANGSDYRRSTVTHPA